MKQTNIWLSILCVSFLLLLVSGDQLLLLEEEGRRSTVIDINYQNLFIVLGLKALLLLGPFGFSSFIGRQDNSEGLSWIDTTDLAFALGFLTPSCYSLANDGTKECQCLKRMSCMEPIRAKEIVDAGYRLMSVIRFLGYSTEDYEGLIEEIELASQGFLYEGNCNKFVCPNFLI